MRARKIWRMMMSEANIRELDRRVKSFMNEEDVVNNPSHYTSGKYEAIDIIEDVTKDLRGLQAFACGNALKYVIRHNKKGKSIEDLNKSIFYIKKMIKDLEEGSDIPF